MEQYIIDLFSVYVDNKKNILWDKYFNMFKKYLKENSIVINGIDSAEKAILDFIKLNKIKILVPKESDYEPHIYRIPNKYIRKLVKFRL